MAIENAARGTILGLISQIVELTESGNNNNVTAWSSAEDKALELARVCMAVQDGILRRGVQVPLFKED